METGARHYANLLLVATNRHRALGPAHDTGWAASLAIDLSPIMLLVWSALVERALGYNPHSPEEILWGFCCCPCLFSHGILIHTTVPLLPGRFCIAVAFLSQVFQLLLFLRAKFLITQAQITNFELGFNRHIRCLPLRFLLAFGLYNESISEALLPLEANGAGR